MQRETTVDDAIVANTDQVRSAFEKPDTYLKRGAFQIRIRRETVREMINPPCDARILDIGCGDGSISLPFLTERNKVTLVDLSSSMLSIARSKPSPELAGNVETINQDFMKVTLEPSSFDVILCIGLLAHAVSPSAVIEKMVSLLKPGGSIIIECTDSNHVIHVFESLFYKFWSFLWPMKYTSSKAIPYREIARFLSEYGLEPKRTFRYVAPLPGVHRILSQDRLYTITRRLFGTAKANRNAWLGNEYLCLFVPTRTEA
jgi:2-polyprenyl-3-methyl-5-hydroxy-6-metoxy-1,4-benzoquinol methylase